MVPVFRFFIKGITALVKYIVPNVFASIVFLVSLGLWSSRLPCAQIPAQLIRQSMRLYFF